MMQIREPGVRAVTIQSAGNGSAHPHRIGEAVVGAGCEDRRGSESARGPKRFA
jgi:hypothetical protein